MWRRRQGGAVVCAGEHTDAPSGTGVPGGLEIEPSVSHHSDSTCVRDLASAHRQDDHVGRRPAEMHVVAADPRVDQVCPVDRGEHLFDEPAVEPVVSAIPMPPARSRAKASPTPGSETGAARASRSASSAWNRP